MTTARFRPGLWAALVTLLGALGAVQAQPVLAPQELQSTLPLATLAGDSRFKVWGVGIYDAKLWVAPGFKADEYERHAFALEITYLRDFSNAALAKRSVEEMQRQPDFPKAQLASWEHALRSAFPDVHKGDRLTAIYRPDRSTIFFTNGRETGVITDAGFGPLFFGIWLSTHSSEPRLREALLAGAQPK
ncbi:MAG: chalcone isomerase family protein [Rhodoferax sp.]|nr:chalcone isomerase family protein [Rhodoferax sp.]